MALNKQQVRHVATLARLELQDAEVSALVTDLGNFLAHVEQLAALDTSDVEPTEHVAVERLALRADVPHAGLTHTQALEGAPRVLNDGFAVPTFVEEG